MSSQDLGYYLLALVLSIVIIVLFMRWVFAINTFTKELKAQRKLLSLIAEKLGASLDSIDGIRNEAEN